MNDPVSPRRLNPQQSESSSGLSGCLIVVILVFVLLGGGALWVYFNAKSVVADLGSRVVAEVIDDTGLPEAEQVALMAEVGRIEEGLKSGAISFRELGKLIETVAESPLGISAMASLGEELYVVPSGLEPSEKDAARVTFQRLARGVMDRQISEADLDPVLNMITHEIDEDGSRRWKETLTDEEVRTLIDRAQDLVEEAGVAVNPAPVDLAGELRRLIDETLGPDLEGPSEP